MELNNDILGMIGEGVIEARQAHEKETIDYWCGLFPLSNRGMGKVDRNYWWGVWLDRLDNSGKWDEMNNTHFDRQAVNKHFKYATEIVLKKRKGVITVKPYKTKYVEKYCKRNGCCRGY